MNFIKTLKSGLTGLLIICTFQTIAQRVNFSGNWHYNKEKSDLSDHPAYSFPAELQVTMTADSIFIDAIINKVNEKTRNTAPAKYSLDGTQTKYALQDNLKRLSSCQISSDKKSLLKKSKTTRAEETLRTVNELWTLSADGKVLNISLTEQDDNQEPYTVIGVFENQFL
ncbi:MAG: hypothetical protein ABIN91_24985 [Mucilaginibacter sp.]|uniref:hypothetical protein n=1 Tax=Mucilaginibacter sp. TaxID=1882438 RepID=UPI0032643917